MRISFASQKLAKLRFIKHILLPREPITESLLAFWAHAKKVMGHAALSSDLRSQKS